jgi:predicted  nucleic acid-binding Zn-ribbon protein
MLNDLQTLNDKAVALAGAMEQLRQENARLRTQVASLSSEHRAMRERLSSAARKLEGLLEQIPHDA